MKFTKHIVALSIISALMGCSPEDQDIANTDEASSNIAVSGAVIDPFITGAIVFADYDNDGVLDTFEPWAYTDAYGFYGSSKEGEDYCTTKPKYCLNISAQVAKDGPVKLVAVGGYDLTTYQKVKTRLSRYFTSGEFQAITPLTSVSDMKVSDEYDYLSGNNFIEKAFVNAEDTQAFKLAFTLHKIIEIINSFVIQDFTEIGDNELLPSDASGFVYDALNKLGKEQNLSVQSFIENVTEEQIVAMLEVISVEIRAAYLIADISPSIKSNRGQNKRMTTAEIVGGAVVVGAVVVSEAVDEIDEGISDDTERREFALKAAARIGQILANRIVEKIKVAKDGDEVKEDAYINVVKNAVKDIIDLVKNDDFDVSSINTSSNVDDVRQLLIALEKATNKTKLPESLAQIQLTMIDESKDTSAKVSMFFSGNTGEQQEGKLVMCVRYKDLDDPENSENTEGAQLEGTWQTISNQLFVTAEFANSERVLRVKTKENNNFVFDYDGDETIWPSVNGFTAFEGSAPTTDQQCKDWFNQI